MPEAEFDRLEVQQQEYLRQREELCAASAKLAADANEARKSVVNCRRDSDAQVMERLRDRHFRLLLDKPAPKRLSTLIDPVYESMRVPVPALSLQVVEHLDQLVIGGGPSVYGLKASNGDENWRSEGAQRSNTRLALSPNGRIVVTGSRDDSLLRFWDAETGQFLFDTDVAAHDAPFAFLTDGRHLAIGARRLTLLDLETKRQRQVTGSSGNASAIAVNGDYIVLGGKSGQVTAFAIERRGDRVELRVKGSEASTEPRSMVVALALSSDKLHLTSVTRSGVISRWVLPDMNRVSDQQGELRFVGYAVATDRNDVMYLSGNTQGRGARGRVVAVDVEAGLTKRMYEDAKTNSPSIALAEQSRTLFIGDSEMLTPFRVATSSEAFDTMESLADGAMANVQTPGEYLDDLRSRGRTPQTSALGELSDDTKVHVIGVYEGELPDGQKSGFRQHPQGQVTVNVGGTGRAVLVLTAYEPVKWTVVPRGVFVDHILLYGYYDQEVVAPPGTRVYTNLQSSVPATYAYKKDEKYTRLARAVREITGRDPDTFQGKYRAGTFSVNVSGSSPDPTQSPAIDKWVDEDGVVHYGDRRTGN